MSSFHCRSNYFQVKDSEAFLHMMEGFPEVEVRDAGERGFMLLGKSNDGWATSWHDPDVEDAEGEDEDAETIHVWEMVAEHLVDDEVAIFLEVGHERLRYLSGIAYAVNNKGEQRSISLNNIYQLAEELGGKTRPISAASY